MPPVAACPDLPRYQQLAAGALPQADEEALLAHLERCPACARKLQALGEPDALVSLICQGRASRDEAGGGPVARLITSLSKLRPGDTSAAQRDETPPPVNAAVPGGATAAYQLPAEEAYDFLAPPQAPDEIGRLGPYRVLEVLGAGGMGVVFRAEDPHLGRLIALKVMRPALAASAGARQRFLREARAAAALKHDHVVTIHQVGEDRGVPFLAMEFLEGEPLDARLEREGKLPVAEVVRIGREIALGLAAAHKRELMHRDIKPANIWLEGEPGASATGGRVKILDFGLARASGDGAPLTHQGEILGTPAYMAPEQARGKLLGGRCDLFSLGCVLYRMVAGRPAFCGTDVISTLMAVATEEPPPPRQLDAAVPPALSDLIMRLLAKEPGDRPASARAVAEALQTISREPGQPPGPAAPLDRPAGGQPTPRKAWLLWTGVAACLLMVVLAGLWAGGVLRVQTRDGTIVLENIPADAEVLVDGHRVRLKLAGDGRLIQIQAPPGQRRLEIKAAGFKMLTRHVTLAGGERKPIDIRLEPVGVARETPAAHRKSPPVRVAAALDAWRRDQIPPAALTLAGGGDPAKAPANLVGVLGEATPIQTDRIARVAFSPDGRRLASASFDGTVLLRDVKTGRVRRVFRGHIGPVAAVAFSKDGRTLVSAGHDGTLKLWPTDRDGGPQTLQPNCGALGALAASPDGRVLAAGGKDGAIKLWKWGQWDSPLSLPIHPGLVRDLAFSPDGELLAAARTAPRAGADGSIRLYHTSDGKPAQAWVADKDKTSVHALAFHPNGKWLASAGQDRHVKLWDLASGKPLAEHGDWTTWSTLAIHPNGKTLYACLAGTNGVLFDLPALKVSDAKGRKTGFLDYAVSCSAFSPDGQFLATGTVTGVVHVWDTTTWKKVLPKHGHSHYVTALAVSRDGRTVLSAGDDNTLRRWHVARPKESRLLHWFDRTVGEVALSPDGTKYITTAAWVYFDAEQRGLVCDAATGKQLFKATPPTGASFAPVFSPDGKAFAGISHNSPDIHLWDANTGKELHRFAKVGSVSPAFSADGKLLATAGGKTIKVWDVAGGDEVQSREDDLPVCTLTLSPDGRRLAAGHADGTISFWSLTATERKKKRLGGHTARVNVLRFTPDGRTLVSCSDDGTVRVWHPERGRALRELIEVGVAKYPSDYYAGLGPLGQTANRRLLIEFDPSGRYLFAAGNSPLIYVLRLPGEDKQAAR